MKKSKTVVGKYIFLDIVGYSHGRSVEAQSDIISIINKIVKEAMQNLEINEKDRILIPTGDGMCIALLDMNEPFDVHIQLALKILDLLHKNNQSQPDEMRQFKVRIGVNENTDNLVIDVNGKKNVAGVGITEAKRIMDQGMGGHIFLGEAVYNNLKQREKYIDKFKAFPIIVKHDAKLDIYQYIDKTLEYVNSDAPDHLKMGDMIRTAGQKFKKNFSSVKRYMTKIEK